jgi:CubicO group peptidase (beta-lactamase class C family)
MNLIPTTKKVRRSNYLFAIVLLWSSLATANDLPELDRSVFGEALQAASQMPRLHSLLISHNGELILEEYFNGQSALRTANVKSVSKSVMSALIGIAIEEGHVAGLDQPIGHFYGDRLDDNTAKSAITIGNLLSMQAGLETTSFYNYGAWVLSDDWIEFALEQPVLSPPGTRMHYSTGNTHLLSDILTRTTGKTTLEFARQQLGRPAANAGFWRALYQWWQSEGPANHFASLDRTITDPGGSVTAKQRTPIRLWLVDARYGRTADGLCLGIWRPVHSAGQGPRARRRYNLKQPARRYPPTAHQRPV